MVTSIDWTTELELPIRALKAQDLSLFDQHFARHCAESGRGDYHFLPFEPGDEEGPKGLDLNSLGQTLTTPGWQRWWVAWSAQQDQIVGHVDLKGDHLKTGLHRCELGIGIEKAFRNHGLGRRLMQSAIAFCRAAPTLAWIDLHVFAHNTNARALYTHLGFDELGVRVDRFRIESASVDDVFMALDVS